MKRKDPTAPKLWAWIVIVFAIPAVALAADVPAPLRAAILGKSLGYEKTLAQRSETLQIGVLAVGGGSSDAGRISGLLSQATRGGVSGRSVKVVRMQSTTGGDAAREAVSRGVEVVYIAAGSGSAGFAIAESLVGAGRLVLCGDPAGVGQGCVVSVEPSGNTSRLVVDVRRALRAGYEFDPRMLRLARVVR